MTSIVIVDDDDDAEAEADLRAVLEYNLTKDGHAVGSAATGAAGLALCP